MPLSRTQKIVAAALRTDGASIHTIATILEVSHQAISDMFNDMARKKTRSIMRVKYPKLIDTIQRQGYPLDVLAKKTGYSYDNLCNAIFITGNVDDEMAAAISHELNLPLDVTKSKGQLDYNKKQKSIYPYIEAYLEKNKMTIADLAAGVNVPYPTVYAALHLSPKTPLLRESPTRVKIAEYLNIPLDTAFELPWDPEQT